MHSAKLISISAGYGNCADLTAEGVIMYCARVSNPSNQTSSNTKLLEYCIKHKHWSIFEMQNMVLEIDTTRAISPQILRHRSFSFQEFSQRYADVSDLMSAELISLPLLRSQDTKNRQASHDDIPDEVKSKISYGISELYRHSQAVYRELIASGVAKECAREVLPLGSPTRLYMNGTIRSWITYIALREKNGTQLEHQMIAKSCKKIFCDNFPITAAALGGYEKDWEI